jgi:hypothetical protein
MKKYIQYYKTKVPYIIAMLLPSIYAQYLIQGYIDRNLVVNNIFTLHMFFLTAEYMYPIEEKFSFKRFFCSFSFVLLFPFSALGMVIFLRILPSLNLSRVVFDMPTVLFYIVFCFILLLAFDHSRHDSDFARN